MLRSDTFEDGVVMLETNYFSVRRLTEELLALRPSSSGAQIVNILNFTIIHCGKNLERTSYLRKSNAVTWE
jgi:hypothetical protein